ncbi:MAG: MBL fold metallo-hydrolase [Patescibacteria group bacterium]|nr:MBL fold metallo-hydrolase [Patescibacteria group bacterium]
MKKILIVLIVGALIVILRSAAFIMLWELPEKPRLISFDAGQGDAILFVVPGTTIQVLVDGGPDNKIMDELENVMPIKDKTIEVVILTHGHEDHLAGLIEVLDNYEVGLVVDSGAKVEGDLYRRFEEQIEVLKIPRLYAVRGEKIKIGPDFYLEILHPFYSKALEYKNLNNASVVMAADFYGSRIVLSGDLEEEGEDEMLDYLRGKNKSALLEADILKIGHHGSRTATGDDFLRAVNPNKAIISCGRDNQFDHPHKETIDKLKERGIETFRTDKLGEVVFDLGK